MKCSECGKDRKHIVFDWWERRPWCGRCFRDFLKEMRRAGNLKRKKAKKK